MYELPACQSTAFCQSLPSVIFCRLYLSAEKCKNYGVIDRIQITAEAYVGMVALGMKRCLKVQQAQPAVRYRTLP